MSATEGMDQFPEPTPLPRMYRQELPDDREDADDAWRADALCAQTDPEAFFPEKGGSTRDAKRICTTCEVRSQCLQYALDNGERFGIWGGLSEKERRSLRKASGRTGGPRFAHGTRYGYSRGCRDEASCPGDPTTGTTCVRAEREFAKEAYTRRKAGAA